MAREATTSPALVMDDLAALATGRSSDFFAEDLRRHASEIRERFEGRRVLVLGGAGSIGASTVGLLSEFGPGSLHVADQNESALAELVRDLRSRPAGLAVRDFRALPIDLGSPVMRRFLKMERSYDWVLNFAALKHVRSEKDVCSILQMLDTNLLKPLDFWEWMQESGAAAPAYFSVSTDKAADPANLMGASKRIMEHLMFCEKGPMASAQRSTSSRFANVAFSNGSLLESFLRRFEKGQPLACPRETKRFFISLREAGEICLLAAACGPDRHIVIPSLDPQKDTRQLDEIAVAFLRRKGLEPEIYRDEEPARVNVSRDLLRNRYPLLLTDLDTQGEKDSEIFAGKEEEVVEFGMSSVRAVRCRAISHEALEEFVQQVRSFVWSPGQPVEKREIVDAVSRIVPDFHHLERHHTLDQRV
ncbi:MAG: polysaccharide biosynthesis protein [Candidatus Acidiferrales bacterium]